MQKEADSIRNILRSRVVQLSWHFSFRITFWGISQSPIPLINSAPQETRPTGFQGVMWVVFIFSASTENTPW